jgi:hypothetical protein
MAPLLRASVLIDLRLKMHDDDQCGWGWHLQEDVWRIRYAPLSAAYQIDSNFLQTKGLATLALKFLVVLMQDSRLDRLASY